ncbi:class I SAM-dependent methyltransferase [Streptomyces sp. NPDC090075]|uniref:class I SAM-dependent methyltransferase n=1 Tax=Streptomyces sp. NPDC090075 TaxID=3365937 RepID=UPI003803D9AA
MSLPDDHGGYGERLLGQSRPGEADRLAALADACDPATLAVLDALPLAQDSRCLDVGAGLGTIARRLLARCPQGRVTAADLDTRFLDGTADPRLDVRRLDVRTADLPAGSFDLIHARNLLAHLPDRERVLTRLVGWLAPGGFLYVEDVSFFPVDSSPHTAYRTLMRAGLATVGRTVGSDLDGWARSYPAPLLARGLTDVGLRVHCGPVTADSPDGVLWRRSLEQVRDAIVDGGAATGRQVEEGLACFADPAFTDLAPALVAAWGRAPRS